MLDRHRPGVGREILPSATFYGFILPHDGVDCWTFVPQRQAVTKSVHPFAARACIPKVSLAVASQPQNGGAMEWEKQAKFI